MIISEVSAKRVDRNKIYDWLKQWIYIQSTGTLEKLFKFITGTTLLN
jgi:hypothetical protein